LGGKVLAVADGKDSCKINVFVIDSSGKGISGKRVTIAGLESANGEVKTSGDNGLTSFEVTSTNEGQFEIVASIEGAPMSKVVKVTFRNE